MPEPTSISFSQIPSNQEVPGAYMEFNAANANNGASPGAFRLLVPGQMLAAGAAQPLVPVRIVSGKAQADVLFGQGSMLSNMIAAAVAANDLVEVWAMPTLDNPAGVAASSTITLTGAATQSGMMTAYIAYSGLIAPAQIAVSAGETAAAAATALAAAINATLDLPVTAAAVAGVVTITARHKGAEAGLIDVRLLYLSSDLVPAGLTAVVVPMAGGAGNPSPVAMIAALGDTLYDVIALPWNDTPTYQAWYTEMTRRWNALVEKEGCIVTAFHGTPGASGTQLAGLNSQFHDCYVSQNPTFTNWVEAAVIAAVYCTNLQARPNAPQKGTLLTNLVAPAQADQLTFTERNTIYLEGGSCWTAHADGTVTLEKAVTTYKTNAAGAADTSYHGRWVMATLTYLRRSWVNWMATRFPTVTFAENGTPVIPGEVTPQILGLSTIAWYQSMMKLGLVQNLPAFQSQLASIQNVQNHARNDQLLGPYLVGPLDIIAGQMAFQE